MTVIAVASDITTTVPEPYVYFDDQGDLCSNGWVLRYSMDDTTGLPLPHVDVILDANDRDAPDAAVAEAAEYLRAQEATVLTITDLITGTSVTVDPSHVETTIRSWFRNAPGDVAEAVSDLGHALRSGWATGDLEALLAVHVERTENVLQAIETGQKAATEAVRQFVATVNQTSPTMAGWWGQQPSKRQERVIDSALEMAGKLVSIQIEVLRTVVHAARDTLKAPAEVDSPNDSSRGGEG